MNISKCGWPEVSLVSVELRMKGCSRVGLAAALRSTKAAVITCGPAFKRKPDVAALIDLVAELRHVDEIRFEVLLAAHVEGVDALAVDRHIRFDARIRGRA